MVKTGVSIDKSFVSDERLVHLNRARFQLSKGICDTDGICDYLISKEELTEAKEDEILR